jgi:Putative Flp pilus-assembly TadE/G-like
MSNARGRSNTERGAVLIHVAVLMLVLIGFLTFVVDHGVMWVARAQAQNAADAGALAGAVAMAYDANGWTDQTATGPARQSAYQMASTHGVIGAFPSVVMATDVVFTPFPTDMCPLDGAGLPHCIRVDVYRNQTRSNPLPSIFGQVFGITAHGVRATATARVAVADASDCLKPWIIPDKWADNFDTSPENPGNTPPVWSQDDTYERFDNRGNPLVPPDAYVAPSSSGPGTGFTVAADRGQPITLKQGSPHTSLQSGVFQPVRIPRFDGGSSGGSDYEDNIASCNGLPVGIGDILQSENGNMIGPTGHGVDALIALDPTARWDTGTQSVINSCATANPSCGRSPRIVAVPVFDTEYFYTNDRNGLPTFRIVNILGFFIDHMQGNDVVGYLMEAPGLARAATAPIQPQSSFLAEIQLIR